MGEYTLTRSDGCVVTGVMSDGKVNGSVVVTYPNGMTKSIEHYSMNVPVGTHEFWDDAGELQHVIKYNDDGQVVEQDGKPVDPVF